MAALDWKRFQQAYFKARKLYLPLEGVLGVGYGHRVVNREATDEFAVIVLVNDKLVPNGKSRDQRIPSIIDGFPIEVRKPKIEFGEANEREYTQGHSDLLMIDWAKVHRMHLAELRSARLAPPPNTDTVGQVFVIEDNGTLVTGATGFDCIDWALAYKYFRSHWGDDYDFVAMYVHISSGMPNPGTSYGETVYNDVVGINHMYGSPYDARSDYGSTRLQGVAVLRPGLASRFTRLHEIAHRWGAFVLFKNSASDPLDHDDLLLADHFHWSQKLDNDTSCMDYDGEDWTANADGSFSRHAVALADIGYCPLDLYLMGMYSPSEVPNFFFINGLAPAATPTDPNRFFGTPVTLSVQNIAWAHGWRAPIAANSQRSFRQAFVVLTKNLASGKTLAATIDGDRIAHSTEFRGATRSRSVLDTYLYTDPYDAIFIQDNSGDSGIEPSSGVFWNSPDIWVRNASDGGTAHQDTIRGQDNFVYVRIHNGGTQASGEITVNLFRANYIGTEFLYPEDWRLEDRIGSQVIASVPPGSDVVAEFQWNSALIPNATWHPCLLAEVLPIHRTMLLLRHVWEDRRIAQKNVTIVDPSAGIRAISLPFKIGAQSSPARWIRLRVRQTEGAQVKQVAIDLGSVNWLDRLAEVGQTPEGWDSGASENTGAQNAPGKSVTAKNLTACQPRTRLDDLVRGGEVVEQNGNLEVVALDPFKNGDIALPLREAERPELVLRLELGQRVLSQDACFEVAQLNQQNQVVGGFDVVVKCDRQLPVAS